MRELFAGVDLGGTAIKVAVAAADGDVLAEASAPTASEQGPDGVIATMADLVAEAAAPFGAVAAVGVGCPGLVDRHSGLTRFLPNLAGQWRDVPLGPALAERLGASVHLLNDARMATLGELRFGWGRDRPDATFVLVTLGTGVGGGVVVDGRLRLGALGAAGELGHVVVDPAGAACNCGSRGCVETVASGPALTGEALRLIRSGSAPTLEARVDGRLDALDPQCVGEAARDGDPGALQAVERAGAALGLALSAMVLALHPDALVLAGGVAAIGEPLQRAIREELERRVTMFPLDDLELVASALGGRAGALGGVALARARGGV